MNEGHRVEHLPNPAEVEQPQAIKTERLLAPGQNPTLTIAEKMLIRALVRKTEVISSKDLDKVEIKGISKESQKLLRAMVEYEGDRLLFSNVVDDLNTRAATDTHNFMQAIRDSELAVISSSVMGDLDSVIKRVSENKGNCLEFNLVMQVIAKAYYPDEIQDVQIMGYTGEGIERSRHFFLYTKQKNQGGSPYSFTTYGGGPHVLNKEEAERKMKRAEKRKQKDVTNVYKSYLKLIEKDEHEIQKKQIK